MDDLTVLLTSCNGMTSPSQIKSLKNNGERNIILVGTDMNELGAGSRLVDKFYQVSDGESNAFVKDLYNICQKEKVSVILPASDEEILNLSRNLDYFKEIGTVIPCNETNTIEICNDKGLFLQTLKNKGLPCANFGIPNNINELEPIARMLGYPDKDIVMKPLNSRGSRGFRIIKKDVDYFDLTFNRKPDHTFVNLSDLIQIIENNKTNVFPKILLMEYLPNNDYSVDILAKNGEIIAMVPKIREVKSHGPSLVSKVDYNPKIVSLVRKISKAFNLNHNVNIQLRLGDDSEPYPYEINPRIAGTIAACNHIGLNLIYYGVKLALKEVVNSPSNYKKNSTMIRYYEELYE